MNHIKLWESFDSDLFRPIDTIQKKALLKGDPGPNTTDFHNMREEPMSITFDPSPGSPLPANLRRPHLRPFEDAFGVSGPRSTEPIGPREVSRYLGLLSEGLAPASSNSPGDILWLCVVVSLPDTPDVRYMLMASKRDKKQLPRLVDAVTKGSLETHHLRLAAKGMGITGLTFLEDNWVLVENTLRSSYLLGSSPTAVPRAYLAAESSFFKCDDFAGVSQAISYLRDRPVEDPSARP